MDYLDSTVFRYSFENTSSPRKQVDGVAVSHSLAIRAHVDRVLRRPITIRGGVSPRSRRYPVEKSSLRTMPRLPIIMIHRVVS
jgi:hypothetical protein